MRIVNVSVSRPIGVIMIVLAVLALGFVSLNNLNVDLFPNIELPIAVVATSYQGAGPEEIEKQITEPLEAALSSIQGIDTIQSQSAPNSSMVLLMFNSGTNMDNALIEIREKVDQVKALLPDNAGEPSVLRFDPQQFPVMQLGLTGGDPYELQLLAEERIAPFLERVEGVASVTVAGGKTREIQVELDRDLLNHFGITAGQVAQALRGENLSASAGVLTKGDQDLQIRVEGEFTSVEDIANTLILLPTGQTIRVSDVANVKDTFREAENIVKVNNEEALVLSVFKQSDANTVAVAEEVQEAMKELQETLPEGRQLSTVLDTSVFIRASIDSVISNMIMGGVVAVAVLVLFLRSARATLVIGISIPIAVISTFILMYFTGETLNILSMGGLALGVGNMVDNSIVILEGIYRYRQEGAGVIEAAKKGASELASAIIASTLTTIVVFVPIIYVEGIAADLFKPLALTVSFSQFSSLLVALTLVPMLSSKMLSSPKIVESSSKGWFNRLFAKVERVYGNMLRWALRRRKTVIALTVILFIGSFVFVPFIGATFIPAADQGQIGINVELASGSQLSETEKVANQIVEKLEPYKDIIKTNYLSIGSSSDGFTVNSHLASFTIELVPSTERDITTEEVIQEWTELLQGIPGAEITIMDYSTSMGMGMGSPISIQIEGPDQEVLRELADQVVWMISDIEGVHNPQSSANAGRPEIQIEVDRDAAAQYGLTYQQVMNEIELSFNGMVATQFRENGSEFDVRVLLPEDERTTIRDLETTTITTPAGKQIPLSAVAELKQVTGPVEITRQNQQRQVNVTTDVIGADLGSVANAIQQKLAGMNFPEGYTYSMGGQVEDMAESFSQLGMALVFAVFLVYLVMAVQFESLIHPLVIMFSMPPTVIGVLFGLFITGTPLSVPAFIGFIMLAGIVVNNAIVLVDYINTLRGRGLEREEAIRKAGPVRLRPIMMTTLTTIVGMLPLALGIGEGAEIQAPLGIVILFGLTASTLVTLILVPVMYAVLEDLFRRFKRLFTFGRRKSAVQPPEAPTAAS